MKKIISSTKRFCRLLVLFLSIATLLVPMVPVYAKTTTNSRSIKPPINIMEYWERTDRRVTEFSVYRETEYACPYEGVSLDEMIHYMYMLIWENGGRIDSESAYILVFRNPSIVITENERIELMSRAKKITGFAPGDAIDVLIPETLFFDGKPYHLRSDFFSSDIVDNNITFSEFALWINTWSNEDIELVTKAKGIAEEAIAYSNDVTERLYYVNKYLCDNVQYDYNELNNGVGDYAPYTAYGALLNGRAVCQGYSRAFSLICYYMKILSLEVESQTHEWNCVYVNGNWKMIDVTWNQNTDYYRGYFLVDTIDDSDHLYDRAYLDEQKNEIMERYLSKDGIEVITDSDIEFNPDPQVVQILVDRETNKNKGMIEDVNSNEDEYKNESENEELNARESNSENGIGGFATLERVVYYPNTFEDIDAAAWYSSGNYGVIQKAYELNIIKGKSPGLFDPMGNILLSEAIAMAAIVHNIYSGGNSVFVQGNPWYQTYVDYAISNEIIKPGDFSYYSKEATRAEMAYIFSGAVPMKELPEINTVYTLPDVTENGKYGESIFRLYRAGILTGNDLSRTFTPNTYITRAEAAGLIVRIVLPTERLRF